MGLVGDSEVALIGDKITQTLQDIMTDLELLVHNYNDPYLNQYSLIQF